MKHVVKIYSIFILGLFLAVGCKNNPAESELHRQMLKEHAAMEAEHEKLENEHTSMEAMHER